MRSKNEILGPKVPRMRQPIGSTPIFKNNKKRGQKQSQMAQPIGSTPNQEISMPSKDRKVISVKVSEKDYQVIETYANARNMTIAAILSLCIKGLIDGEIRIEKGELKTGVDPNGCAVSEESDTPFGQKIEKRMDKLRERGYPDNFIYSLKEQILNGLDNQIEMLPKRYDTRRVRDDWGC